ncbi:MAG: DUF7768 domain-containing protein [Saccharofermentanales bacterium]
MMKKVYICSPLRGDAAGNIQKAKEYSRYAIKECGVIPITPHIYFTAFLDDTSPQERELGIQAGLELLRDCDEVWVFGDRLSEGMKQEIEFAHMNGIPVDHIDLEEFRVQRQMAFGALA